MHVHMHVHVCAWHFCAQKQWLTPTLINSSTFRFSGFVMLSRKVTDMMLH